MLENIPSDMCARQRFKSVCAFTQSDLNLHWAKFLRADNKDWSDCTGVQADLILQWAHVFEGAFSDILAHVFVNPFIPSGLFYLNSLDRFISYIGVSG